MALWVSTHFFLCVQWVSLLISSQTSCWKITWFIISKRFHYVITLRESVLYLMKLTVYSTKDKHIIFFLQWQWFWALVSKNQKYGQLEDLGHQRQRTHWDSRRDWSLEQYQGIAPPRKSTYCSTPLSWTARFSKFKKNPQIR